MEAVNQEVIFDLDSSGVATLTLNRPEKMNALSTNMIEHTLPELCTQIMSDVRVKVVLVTGAGQGFCSGADVSQRLQSRVQGTRVFTRKDLEQPIGRFVIPLDQITKPVIAAVNGVAAGVGLSLACLCDIRIASERARFGAIFVRRGLMPDGGLTFSLPRIVGISRALELMFTGDIIDAQEAMRIGLVTKVVPQEQLEAATMELANKICKVAPLSNRWTKQLVYRAMDRDLDSHLAFTSQLLNMCFQTEDSKEGIRSFLEKREAHYKGR